MAGQKKADVPEITEIRVKAGTVIGAAYAQVVGVTVTDNDLMFEFVFINPRAGNEGEVVSRVILPLEAAQGLTDAINTTLTKHFGKKGD
jgi:hypothetical protein